MQTKFDTVVQVVTACSSGETPRVSAEFAHGEWTIRISGQTVVYKGGTLDAACKSLLDNWQPVAVSRLRDLALFASWIRDAYGYPSA